MLAASGVTRIILTLLLEWLAAATAVGLAVCALAGVAALVEGHPPDLERLRVLALPAAGFLGAAWVLARWRARGEDIAWANLGRPPLLVALLLASASSAPVLLGTATPAAAGWSLRATEAGLRGHSPRGAFEVTWAGGRAHRSDLPRAFAGFPAPTRLDPGPSLGWGLPAARVALLLALLAFLTLRAQPPGLPLTASSAGLCFGGAHALMMLL